MKTKKYDISGWVTRYNTKCTDGKTILPGAFAHNDKTTVPMLWNHRHDDVDNVLGHIDLEHRPNEGVYGYGYFNENAFSHSVSNMVKNKDISRMSIYATNIVMNDRKQVSHGVIQEVSLVLAGANPGAYIDVVLKHSDSTSDAIIYNDNTEDTYIIRHNDEKEDKMQEGQDLNEYLDKLEDLTFEQRLIVLSLAEALQDKDIEIEDFKELLGLEDKEDNKEEIGEPEVKEEEPVESRKIDKEEADESDNKEETDEPEENKEDTKEKTEKSEEDNKEETDEPEDKKEETLEYLKERKDKEMKEKIKHNIFENNEADTTLMHGILTDIYKNGVNNINLENSILQHAEEMGIKDIKKLFPEATEEPTHSTIIRAKSDWVMDILNKLNKTPFSNVKTTYIKIDEAEARAKGYFKKGELKKDIKLKALNRSTSPITVYAKMNLHRDDLLDLEENDALNKTFKIKDILEEKVNEEIARAVLLGDGRTESDDDKINEQNIRPIIKDDEMYTIKYTVKDNTDFKSTDPQDSLYKGMIRGAIKARKDYMGSGSATLYTSEECLAELLLIEDKNGRAIYETIDRLCSAFRVQNIVTIPNFNNGEDAKNLLGIIVNMKDYTLGDPGVKNGRQTYFEGFNLDKNINQFLYEKRHSGALSTPKSAIALYKVAG